MKETEPLIRAKLELYQECFYVSVHKKTKDGNKQIQDVLQNQEEAANYLNLQTEMLDNLSGATLVYDDGLTLHVERVVNK